MKKNVSSRNSVFCLNPLICFVGLLLFLSGCYHENPIITELPTFQPLPAIYKTVPGESVEKKPLECYSIGTGDDCVLFMASIHGDEYAGTPLLHSLIFYLQKNPTLLEGKKVVTIPIANPDGYAHNTRFNVNGVDLNRNFAADNRENNDKNGNSAFSEPESKAIDAVIRQYKPNRIISIHQPLSCIDYDGRAEPLAKYMGQNGVLPVKHLGTRPGSLGAYAGITLNIPIVTLELKPGDENLDNDALWDKYGNILLAAIAFSGDLH